MNFAQILKEFRTEKGYTQKTLAQYLSLSSNVICEWEKGRCEPSIESLKKLSTLFDCSIDVLVGNNGNTDTKAIPTAKIATDEEKLLSVYRQLNTKNKMHVSAYAQIRLEEQDGGAPSSLRWK